MSVKQSQPPNLIGGRAVAGVLPGQAALPDSTWSIWQIRITLFWRGLKNNWGIFSENPIGLVGLAVISLFILMAVAHPILIYTGVWPKSIYDPVKGIDLSVAENPAAPSADHLLGTDPIGRDILSQLLFSTASEFGLGMIAAVVTVVIGTMIGSISAYFRGIIDIVFMRLADLVIMTPVIPLLIVLSAVLATNGMKVDLPMLGLVLGLLSGFGGTNVVIKSQALGVMVKPYVEAARVAGGGNFHIIFTHIIPNLLPISFLYMMFTVTDAIFSEAVLSYFGLLNVDMSWGLMIQTTQYFGFSLAFEKWWLLFPASLSVTALCSAFYLVGRAMDEVVNPRLRRR